MKIKAEFERDGSRWIIGELNGSQLLVQAEWYGTLSGQGKEQLEAIATCGDHARAVDIRNADDPGQGRAGVLFCEIGAERFVLRRNHRGGAAAMMLSDRYRRPLFGEYRPFQESFILSLLRAKGVAVPAPAAAVASFSTLGVLYRGALLTREIPESENLFRLIRRGTSDNVVLRLAASAGGEARKMLDAGVFHPDLHPANVLASGGRVWLIDFDNARRFTGGGSVRAGFAARLAGRFERFCWKYQLGPVGLATAFAEQL